MIVHYLSAGKTLCLMEGTPDQWPEGHVWVNEQTGNGTKEDITCPDCKRILEELEGM